MPEPVAYQRVARDLRERIHNGTYAPGTKLPSLREIEAEYEVSRATSRAAYQLLISEGTVEGRFGGGYYVRSYRPIIRHGIQRLAGQATTAGQAIWDVDPGTAGRELVVDQVQVSTEEPPGDVANDLGIETDARTVVRRRRYVLDGKPVLLSTSHFPADIAHGTPIEQEDTGPGGAYARLADAGEAPAWFQEDVTARMPSPHETTQLQLPPGSPVFAIRRVVWGPTGRALEVNTMVGDAGSYVLRYRWHATQPEIEQPTDPT